MANFFKHFFNVIKWVLFSIVVLILVVNIYTIARRKFSNDPFPTVLGFGSAVVISDSMETEISRGDVIIIHKVNKYDVGDVVMYADGDSFTTHRLIDVREGNFITKGDNNDSEDSPVSPDRVIGRVCLVIPAVGKLLSFFSNPWGLLTLFFLGCIIIFLPELKAILFGKEETAEENGEGALSNAPSPSTDTPEDTASK